MQDLALRLVILAGVCALIWLAVGIGRYFVERQRRQALAAEPLATTENSQTNGQHVSILAFSSDGCRQCHTMQHPALERLLHARKEQVTVIDVDAVTEHALTERYKVLTLPTTVVLDGTGNVQAVNYGFATTQRLLAQVDAVLAHVN